MKHIFYDAIGVDGTNRKEVTSIAKKLGIPVKKLDYYDSNGIFPDENDLALIHNTLGLESFHLQLNMGVYDMELKATIAKYFQNEKIILGSGDRPFPKAPAIKYQSKLGTLHQGDCIDLLLNTASDSFDLIFADPPFNLKKFYLSEIDDDLGYTEYIQWTESWLKECIRVLKPGGALFLWNIPRWNTYFSEYLNRRLYFRHWIATDIKYSLPIAGRLYPSHYSLLYYTKGDNGSTFHPDRLPMEICPKCYTDLKDYGGYKNKMNPSGINISDIWYDIPPVRHSKYKKRKEANELSIKLLDRIIEMASNEGDHIFDPFGGAGTTYAVAEMKNRKWTGIELGPVDIIIKRFENLNEEKHLLEKYRKNYNKLFPQGIKEKRHQLNLWTDESFKKG
jgi:site-specific DNA-methyltransferase (adenine-specific)